MKKALSILFILFLALFKAEAQFYSSGTEPGCQRWSQIKTDNYRIIYPEGLDSLAFIYGRTLEGSRSAVGASIGIMPNEVYQVRLPVILHAHSAISNGLVTWTPRRMELYTTPDPYTPGAVSWITDLSIHESRHVSQMQFSRRSPYRLWDLMTGELFYGAMAAIYPNTALMEGDAVVAETALTPSGRGRSADFIEYYRSCLTEDESRGFYQWRYGSDRLYAPDHYRLGYVTVAGVRTFFDDPLFLDRYYGNINGSSWPNFPLGVLPGTIRQSSGMGLRKTFRAVSDSLAAVWTAENVSRAPYMPFDKVLPATESWRDIIGLTTDGNVFFAQESSLEYNNRLVRIGRDGSLKPLRAMASYVSDLSWDDGTLFWTELSPDRRWEMVSTSRIRELKDGKIRDISTHGKLYSPIIGEGVISAVEFFPDGRCAIRVVDDHSGETLETIPAPDSLQLIEADDVDGHIIAICVAGDCGIGFYDASDGFRELLPPVHTHVKQLRSMGSDIAFLCDRTGVNELYTLSLSDGTLRQLTNTSGGLSDCLVVGDSLYYCTLCPKGRELCRTALSDLPIKKVSYEDQHHWVMAEELSAQEDTLPRTECPPLEISGPKHYSRLSHAVKIHSWAPIWFDSDAVSSLSLESVEESVSAGASLYFQNDLGTLSGCAGISASDGAHLSFTYSGLYPVFEVKAHMAKTSPLDYFAIKDVCTGTSKMYARTLDGRSATASILTYVPLNFSSGGWSRGIIPQVKLSLCNSLFSTSKISEFYPTAFGDQKPIYTLSSWTPGKKIVWSRLSASLRAYSILPCADACRYPRLGLGAEAGIGGRPGASYFFAPTAYEFFYGYVPGLLARHSVRLSALAEQSLGNSPFQEWLTSCTPRGLNSVAILDDTPGRTLLTADYAFPIASLDCDWLCPALYLKTLEGGLFADMAFPGSGSLSSVGASLTVKTGNFLWLPYETRIGVRWCLNGGSLFENLPDAGRNTVQFIFDIDL